MPVRNKRADEIKKGDVVLDRAGRAHKVTKVEISFAEGVTIHFEDQVPRTFRVSDKLPVRT
jgi:preprotein translocase subunit YajC